MIDANSKTNSFLQAIEKYAEEQKNAMKAEVEAFREEQLARANEEGTAAAFAFIQTEKARFAASLAKEKSQKEAAVKRELYGKRNKMAESVFVQAEKKLMEFVKSKKYKDYIEESAKNIGGYVGDAQTEVFISSSDQGYIPVIQSHIRNCTVQTDSSIRLGGIRASCGSMSILLDETLDTKLEIQKKRFVAESGFTVE